MESFVGLSGWSIFWEGGD